MLLALQVGEQRYRAVQEVLPGASVTEVARRLGRRGRSCTRGWAGMRLRAGWLVWGIGSSRPHACPDQMSLVVERGSWRCGGRTRRGGSPDPLSVGTRRHLSGAGPTSIYRALVRHGLVEVEQRRLRRADHRRWERGRPMKPRRMDVVSGFHLVDGTLWKAGPGDRGNSRFVVSAMLVRRATAGPMCQALLPRFNGPAPAGRLVRGGSVRPVLRRERNPTPVDRTPVADHDREG